MKKNISYRKPEIRQSQLWRSFPSLGNETHRIFDIVFLYRLNPNLGNEKVLDATILISVKSAPTSTTGRGFYMNWNDLRVRERLEEVGNYIALSAELHANGIVLSERARAGLFELGVMQLQNLDAAIKGQLIEGSAPS